MSWLTRRLSRSLDGSSNRRPTIGPDARNWSSRKRSESDRWAAQLRAAASANGAIRIRKANQFHGSNFRWKRFRQQWQHDPVR